jgi:hypothetical protein
MEQRKVPRSTITTLVKVVYSDQIFLAETIDVSLSGLSCFLPVDLSVAHQVLLSFRLEPKMKPITVWAIPIKSVPAKSGRYRVGLAFNNLDSSDYQRLAASLSERWLNSTPKLI